MDVLTNSCRICLGKDNLKDLYDEELSTPVPITKIMYCASVQIERDDNLPQKICKQCLYYLDCSYIFKTLCEETDRKLHKLYEEHLNEDVENDSFVANTAINEENNLLYRTDSVLQKDLNVVEYIVYDRFDEQEQKDGQHNLDETTEEENHLDEEEAHNATTEIEEHVLDCSPNEDNKQFEEEEEEVCNKKGVVISKLLKSPVGRHIAKKNASKCPQRYGQSDLIKSTKPHKSSTVILNDVILSQTQKDNHEEELENHHTIPENEIYILENDMPMGLYMETVVSEETNEIDDTVVEMNPIDETRTTIVNETFNKKKSKSKPRLSPIKLRKGNRKINVFIDQNTKKVKPKRRINAPLNLEESNLKCDVCSKSFPYRSHLIRHLNVHTGIKRYDCEYCSKKFINTYNLSVHIRKHTGDFPLSCKVCHKGFTTPSVLKRHVLSHTGDTNFECKFCTKKFAHSSSLKLHEEMHVNRPKFVCDICFKIFSYKNSLTAHKKTHLGIKTHNCNVCHKAFSRKTSLERHMLGHTNLKKIKCKFCNVWFSHSSSYASHVRMHSNYDCEYCDQSFLTKGLLANHVKKHYKKDCFKCDQCCKKFSHKMLLVKHLQKHVDT